MKKYRYRATCGQCGQGKMGRSGLDFSVKCKKIQIPILPISNWNIVYSLPENYNTP